MRKIYFLILYTFFFCNLNAAAISLNARSAVVWLPHQVIKGSVRDITEKSLLVHVNDSVFSVTVHNEKFTIDLLLFGKQNVIWVETKSKQNHATSDTIFFELGYKPLPLVVPYTTSKGDTVFFHALIKTNPFGLPLRFLWSSDAKNPAVTVINNSSNMKSFCILPRQRGDYYFNLTVIAGNDTVKYETLVVKAGSIRCFDLQTDYAAWIDSAIMYEITPHLFTEKSNYKTITEKLPELKRLGINCIWLQPVYKTHNGHQGYDITDFFSLRNDLGTEEDLQQLITAAKNLSIKILFDFVPNHVSVFHPYAQDVIANGSNSHYYNFFQHENDSATYSSLYNKDSLGFYHYFWKQLVNLNYTSEEVQQWIIEACKYWLTKFDLDGFRFDAAWAVRARNDSFGLKLQTALKSIKPYIFLLSEDKGEAASTYKGYDAAYDWRSDTNWISRWSWQYDYNEQSNLTIFNFPDENKRSENLSKALFSEDKKHSRLRFMENNDLPGFITYHGLQKTKMVAAFMFALPGIPLIYNGQETGRNNKVYSTKPVFKSNESIQSQDSNGLFACYQQLIQLRSQYKSMRSMHMQQLACKGAGSVIALYKWIDDEKMIVAMNMSKDAQPIIINTGSIHKNRQLLFTDILQGDTVSSTANNLKLNMPPYSTKLLLLKN